MEKIDFEIIERFGRYMIVHIPSKTESVEYESIADAKNVIYNVLSGADRTFITED